MSFYLLDGRLCPALPLDELEPDGSPRRMVYFYKGTEGGGIETRVSASLLKVPDDNGGSWGPGDVPNGANPYIEVGEGVNLQTDVLDRLLATHANQQRAVSERAG